MSGIYIHIPFCKQACHYCNFHFSTSLKLKDALIDAICTEIRLRKDYLKNNKISTIYFGGGTPSLLTDKDFDKIFTTLLKYYEWKDNAEITLEANPDDITKDSITIFQKWGINRLSIGVQSFYDEDLTFMNRAHNAKEALRCIGYCQDAGLENLSIDLIYGSNTTTDEMWLHNIEQTIDMKIPHVSAYCLTVEEKTALFHMIKTNKIDLPNIDKANDQFSSLMDILENHGYDHYEISNFSLPEQYAVHNTNYWKGVEYIGIGPSAHSYDVVSRSWNVANNKKYIDQLALEDLPLDTEYLNNDTRYNEYLMTGLRTMWGIDLSVIQAMGEKVTNIFLSSIKEAINDGMIKQNGNNFTLTKNGKYYADRIAMNLFSVD
ncbi:MAG: radical SAM family heme chaperone HemW [Saprospiraceae bacterium]|nr:radical SAM family heme chaperone HemW [Saprospiraceae bacterium]